MREITRHYDIVGNMTPNRLANLLKGREGFDFVCSYRGIIVYSCKGVALNINTTKGREGKPIILDASGEKSLDNVVSYLQENIRSVVPHVKLRPVEAVRQ